MRSILSPLLILLLLSPFRVICPQNDFQRIEKFTVNEGLSQNYIFDILQDSRGFMWFATKEGLNRYDGYSVVVYRNDPFDSTSLSSNNVNAIFEDENQTLWVGTNGGGLNKFDRVKENFVHYDLPSSGELQVSYNYVNSINQGSGNKLWIGSNSGPLLFDVKSGRFKKLFQQLYLSAKLCSGEVSDILEERDTVWFASSFGLFYLVKRNNSLLQFPDYPYPELKNHSVRFIFRDSRHRLFAGKRLGLFLVNSNGFKPIFTANQQNNMFWAARMREDKNGSLWAATNDIVQVSSDLNKIEVKKHLEERFTRGMFIDRSGIIWCGTGGYGVFMIKPHQQQFGTNKGNFLSEVFPEEIKLLRNYGSRNNLPRVYVEDIRASYFNSVVEDNNGIVWFLTVHGLFSINRNKGQVRLYKVTPGKYKNQKPWLANKVFCAPDGNIWVATVGGINKLNKKDGTFTHFRLYPDSTISTNYVNKGGYADITAIHADKKGIIWCGTPDLGLISFDEKSNTIKRYYHQRGKVGTLLNNNILSIAEDPYKPDSILWLGTEGGGLNRLNTRTGSFTYFTKNNGLPNDVIYSILTDGKKNFWMSTNHGLVKFNPQTKYLQWYDVQNGLQSNEFNRNEYYKTKEGKFYFGGIYGYNTFFPDDIKGNNNKPLIAITDFKIFNKSAKPFEKNSPLTKAVVETDSIVLEYSQNMFSFEFAALDYQLPLKNRYRYKLEGFDEQWISADQSRTANYTNIDPGEYVFYAIGSNNDGVWNEEGKKIYLTILPPVWMTWWFRCLIAALTAALIAFLYYLRISHYKKERIKQEKISQMLIQNQEDERKRIAHEMHDSLGQELLLIKNRALIGLRTASELSKEKIQLEKISEGASTVLNLVRDLSHSLRPPELDRLGLTETIRCMLTNIHESGLYSVANEIENIDKIIPEELEINLIRILQESLNNIVKHSRATEIKVCVIKSASHILLSIADNGIGFNRANSKLGLGLAGITERVHILKGTISIYSEEGEGTIIKIHIPILLTGRKNDKDSVG